MTISCGVSTTKGAGRDEHGRLGLVFEVEACNASEIEP